MAPRSTKQLFRGYMRSVRSFTAPKPNLTCFRVDYRLPCCPLQLGGITQCSKGSGQSSSLRGALAYVSSWFASPSRGKTRFHWTIVARSSKLRAMCHGELARLLRCHAYALKVVARMKLRRCLKRQTQAPGGYQLLKPANSTTLATAFVSRTPQWWAVWALRQK